jgi:cytochrome b561
MPTRNSAASYGSISKTFHWLTALLIFTLIPLGIIANGLPFDTSEELAAKARLFSLHKTLGLFVFFVALARILWALRQTKPDPLHPDRRAETFLAEMVHWLLYGSLLLVPLSGWIHHASTEGFAPIWWPFGQNMPLVPKSETLAATTAGLHIVFERVLVISILLHVAGALKHHIIDRDATLRRMWFGQNDARATGAQHAVLAPALGALCAWALAVLVGLNLGVYNSHHSETPAAQLDAVESDWDVTAGQIEISVTQLGSEVKGQFADWTASIAFDETAQGPKMGTADVTIAIGSLTLGSVTAQALGPDYFNADAFATARFQADIEPAPDGYIAKGSLTIRDVSLPVELPFTLQIVENEATMRGELTLNRMDYNIGTNMPDESSLKHAVAVSISVTATRAAP